MGVVAGDLVAGTDPPHDLTATDCDAVAPNLNTQPRRTFERQILAQTLDKKFVAAAG